MTADNSKPDTKPETGPNKAKKAPRPTSPAVPAASPTVPTVQINGDLVTVTTQVGRIKPRTLTHTFKAPIGPEDTRLSTKAVNRYLVEGMAEDVQRELRRLGLNNENLTAEDLDAHFTGSESIFEFGVDMERKARIAKAQAELARLQAE